MNTKNKFPLNSGLHGELSDAPVRINGMKVLFDEKVQLMPVKLIKQVVKN